jgi:HK97 family phage major capsid protein
MFVLQLRFNVVEEGSAAFEKQAMSALGKIEDSVASQKTTLDDLTTKYGNLDKSTKEAFEELTEVKNSTNASIESFTKAMKTVQDGLRRELIQANGNPVVRIQKDEELRTRFNVAVRLAMDSGGDMMRLMAPQMKDLSEGTTPGSTYINTQLLKEIYDTLLSYGVWNTFGVKQMGTRLTRMPVKTARASAGFVLAENTAIPDDAAKAGTEVTLQVEIIASLLGVSMSLLQDSEIDVTADVLSDFAESYAFRLDYAALAASGAADVANGGMIGVFTGATPAPAGAGAVSVSTLKLNDFIRCLTTVDPAVLQRQAKWWIHPTVLAKIVGIVDLNGRPLFQTALEAPAPGAIGSILGYPVVLSGAAPSTDAISSPVAVFGDPQGQVVGIRSDFVFEASDQFRWSALQRTFRGWGRAGTKIRRATAFAKLVTAAA